MDNKQQNRVITATRKRVADGLQERDAHSQSIAVAINEHKAAQAMVDTVADGPKNVVAAAERWSDEFLKEVVEMPCESDDDFFVKASYLLDCERNAWGLLTPDEPFGRLALATELHSISRAQLRVRRIRERIMEDQQKHATSLNENVTTGDA